MAEKKPTSKWQRFRAMQDALPKFHKDATVDVGKYDYSYITLNQILAGISKPLRDHNFLIVRSTNGDGTALRTVLIDLEDGEELVMVATPIPPSNNPQSIGSSHTYGRRYGLVTLLDIIVDKDDDGIASAESTPDKMIAQKKTFVLELAGSKNKAARWWQGLKSEHQIEDDELARWSDLDIESAIEAWLPPEDIPHE